MTIPDKHSRPTKLSSLLAVIACVALSCTSEAADTQTSATVTSTTNTGSARSVGNSVRVGTWARDGFVKSHAFSQDDGSMSVSSSIAARLHDRSIGRTFNLTIGREGSSLSTGTVVTAGEDTTAEVEGRSNQAMAKSRARGLGDTGLSRTFSRSLRR